MTDLKTRLNHASVSKFIAAIEDGQKRRDSEEIIGLMREATGADPKMRGTNIVGFGSYHFKYASGREGDWMLCGFSPRKQNLALYIMSGFKNFGNLLKKLGKHSTGKSCPYLRRRDNVDRDVLQELIRASVEHMRDKYGARP